MRRLEIRYYPYEDDGPVKRYFEELAVLRPSAAVRLKFDLEIIAADGLMSRRVAIGPLGDMRKARVSGFDVHWQQMLSQNPRLAEEHARQFAELPLATQLAILRRRRWLSQEAVAKAARVRQPHVARVESSGHDPRLSSVVKQAKALDCRLIVVPEELLPQVARLVAAGQQYHAH